MRALISAYYDRRRPYVWRSIAENSSGPPGRAGVQLNRLLGFFGPSYYLSTYSLGPSRPGSSLMAICPFPTRASDKTTPQVSGATGRAR